MNISSAYFSDTVLFWTHYDTLRAQVFTHLMAEAICFSIESELPLRGALSVGSDLVLDRESGTFLGEALVEAARTEREQVWIGLSFGKSFQQPPRNQGFDAATVLSYKSHYKNTLSPYVTGVVVDWPRKWRDTRSSDVRPLVKALDRNAEYTEYYARTLAFVDFSERNHDWFLHEKHIAPG